MLIDLDRFTQRKSLENNDGDFIPIGSSALEYSLSNCGVVLAVSLKG